MRVYEFAKIYDLTSKQVIDALKGQNVDVANHMSVIPDDKIAQLEVLLGVGQKSSQQASKASPSQPSGKQEKPELSAINEQVPGKVEDDDKLDIDPQKRRLNKVLKAVAGNVIVVEPMTVGQFAQRSGLPVNQIILTLIRKGLACTMNHPLDEKQVLQLAEDFELKATYAEKQDSDQSKTIKKTAASKNAQIRLPVIVVMGHVDHGKTTLLDYIRNTRVVQREAGGITQHLGAYEVTTDHGNLIFLDTPGHEAFSAIRMRGARVADIAILMVAADDGIMPQTVEAINHARAAKIPMIVAINKMDKADPKRVEAIYSELAQNDLLPEAWGGQISTVPVSALKGDGVDNLLEIVALQAEMLELKADLSVAPQGYVLESKLERGRGPVATVICQNGILKIGDYFAAGRTFGRVNSLVDSYGKRVTQVQPSQPARIAGFQDLPKPGDSFNVISASEFKKLRQRGSAPVPRRLLLQPGSNLLNVIVKSDTQSSREAVRGSLDKVSLSFDQKINIILDGVGSVTESDVTLAVSSGAIIYGLHSKVEPNAVQLATREGVDIRLFTIIYKLIEDVEKLLEQGKEIKMISKKIGDFSVLKVFDIKRVGIVAGGKVNSGFLLDGGQITIYRRGKEIGQGIISSLQKERKSAKRVLAGFECAFLVVGHTDWQVDDTAECFQEVPEDQA
ncbi:translation initiation factor IF-2 [bacterium]|jgi:translation initiation factor IF-2|nr:translation initiation factor IF-2 [bacterium]MBT3903789.1 translation initiation factor IF-2 [bacterium]MBT4577989.1 translation initiation factor IF-2 [bacterium]MBT5346226.1 translation initiation factor IF-2 [bacterium]MBT6131022.1 translation initiation factor IF-2 [bacterium]